MTTDITGFKKYSRKTPKKDPIKERVQNYKEFVHLYSEEELNKQSARCMDCGIPFCHSGCPLGNVIPEFNEAVYNAKWEEAYDILVSTNNFPEFTGRICPAPCESACVLGIHNKPVTIEEIEKHIIEIAFNKGFVKANTSFHKTGKRIAVVGSGPAGLAAAAQLIRVGHEVVVYERDDKAGGLLQYGIPDFKLEKWVIERRIKLLEEEGVVFRFNAEVGKNVPTAEIMAYDAVILAVGSTVPRNLDIPGKELKGVHFAMDYLKQQNKRVAGLPVEGEDILATGKHVLVIGSGDTGSDCVGTANRQKAIRVGQIAWKPMLPMERTVAMPWPTFPQLHTITSSHEEGVERHYSLNTKAFVGDENGRLKGVKVTQLSWELDDFGRPTKFEENPDSELEMPCELALIALGFSCPQSEGLLKELGVELDRRGNVLANEKDYKTSIDKVFVAGDARRGQSLVVWAISEGREAARQVDEFLMGHSVLETKNAVAEFANF
ncbi:glutamate synthase subunit beta [Olivibacter sitiensis]|uniref:glutamate synthase subunit beta n=1 Tax=Olivibacter sitiensis TaxID=376470 RepID=UPI00040ED2E5|nr:glutamate synthase subunit beta [Olivibacter sitiensis]